MTKEKITKKSFEGKLSKKFNNLSVSVTTERKVNNYGELANVKVNLYYENDRHIATWFKGSGIVL